MKHSFAVAGLSLALAVACTTSPLGRRQFRLFPAAQMNSLGVAAFDKIKSEKPASRDARVNAYVRCVADAVTGPMTGAYARPSWDVVVFEDASANAFALPGGKIGVHTGILQVARTPDQLATVLGHEVGHVVADHGNERVSTAFAAQSGAKLVELVSGAPSAGQEQLMGLLGVGLQVGVMLPFGRAQESEADLLGLDLMARAGFDPRESVALWRNMAAAGGAQPPEFLSTHPSHATRIAELEKRIPQSLLLYEQAHAAGRRPPCE